MPARLTLISHAPTQAQRRASFPLDESIEDREIARLTALAWLPPKAQQVLAAPELRTRQTAHALGLLPVIVQDLRDCDYGTWSGCTLDALQTEAPEAVFVWLTDPSSSPHQGESITMLIARVASWLTTLHDAGHTIAVTHPAVIRAAIVHVLQAPPQSFWRIDIAPATLTDLRFNGKVWTVRSVANVLHSTHEQVE